MVTAHQCRSLAVHLAGIDHGSPRLEINMNQTRFGLPPRSCTNAHGLCRVFVSHY